MGDACHGARVCHMAVTSQQNNNEADRVCNVTNIPPPTPPPSKMAPKESGGVGEKRDEPDCRIDLTVALIFNGWRSIHGLAAGRAGCCSAAQLAG